MPSTHVEASLKGWPNNHVRGCILEELLVTDGSESKSIRNKLKRKKGLLHYCEEEQQHELLHKINFNHVQEQGVPDGPGHSGLGDVIIGILDPVGQVHQGCWEGCHIDPSLQLSPQEEVTCSFCVS